MSDSKIEIPQWVPASERMPEEYACGEYWVTVIKYDGCKDTIVSNWNMWCKGGTDESHWAFDWWENTSRHGKVRRPIPRERVLAWLPLPQAYMLGHKVTVESNSISEYSDERTATWLRTHYNDGDEYHCSCCKERRIIREVKGMKYCPNCGAKMSIEEKR